MPLPRKIANAPELQIGLEFYFFAFKYLNTCRSYGFALGPISWDSINNYADVYGLNLEEKEDFFSIINRVDEEFLIWQNTKASKN